MIEYGSNEDLFKQVEGLRKFIETYAPANIAFKHGGYIAGGFLRNCIRTGKVEPDYFNDFLSGGKGGDIDFFFPDEKSADDALAELQTYAISKAREIDRHHTHTGRVRPIPGVPSMTGYATTWMWPHMFTDFSMFAPSYPYRIKTQFITGFTGTKEETLSRFDFENCKIALDGDSYMMSDELLELEDAKTLKVVTNHSPCLAWRVSKYVTRYGYTSFEDSGRELIVDWLMKYRQFTSNDSDPKFLSAADREIWDKFKLIGMLGRKNQIMEILHNDDLVSDEELVLFIGMFDKEIRNYDMGDRNYGAITHVDAATSIIRERAGSPPEPKKTPQVIIDDSLAF